MDKRYPLHWPDGQERTPKHERIRAHRYSVSEARALDDLLHELELMDAREVIVSTNIKLRLDGLPYSNQRTPEDPGVAVYWKTRSGLDVCIACDQYVSMRDNYRAVGLSIAALRAIERAGATQILERAYRGFSALPASTITPAPRKWWTVLGFEDTSGMGCSKTEVHARYLELVRERHPDKGGTHEGMVELNRAWEDFLREVGS